MTVGDPPDRFAAAHAATGRDLGRLLDVEGGLREVLVAAEHTATGRSLELDVEAGLAAIVPAAQPPVPQENAAGPAGAAGGLVAARLSSLDTESRLAVRTHPALDGLATALEVGAIRDRAHELVRVLRRGHPTDEHVDELARNLESALVRVGGRHHGGAVAGDLDSALDHEISRARDLVHILIDAVDGDSVRAVAPALRGSMGTACDLAQDLARSLAHDRTLPHRFTIAIELDLDLDADSAGRARALDRARHDFTTADLRRIDLSHLSLVGLRWSAATRWPSEQWRSQALLDSTELADGVYEIHDGSTTVPTRAR